MDFVKSLPKGDGTTSTNHGSTFEVYSLALVLLNSCKLKKKVKVWINKVEYHPWDDLVIEIDGKIICVQLKHTKDFNYSKLEEYMSQREEVIKRNKLEETTVVFIFSSVCGDKKALHKYEKADPNQEILNLILTGKQHVYHDQHFGHETFLCMKQMNVIGIDIRIRDALKEYIGIQNVSKDFLKTVQVVLVEYIQNRYYRLIKENEPLTSEELTEQLGYILLNKFKIPLLIGTGTGITNNLSEILPKSNIIALDHRSNTILKSDIWNHLLFALKKESRKMKQETIDSLWMTGKLHMPLSSPDILSDREILRALEILDFAPKVLVLRPRVFHAKIEQKVFTIMQNVQPEDYELRFTSGSETETFKCSLVQLDKVRNSKVLHQDFFGKLAKKFTGKSMLEAHDEYHYVNDLNAHGDEICTALIFCIKLPKLEIKVIEHLISLGANVDAAIAGGHGPLYFALKANRLDLVRVLLEHGANPNAADRYGNPPLYYAVADQKLDMVETLVRHGANAAAADFYGDFPIFWAYALRNFAIMEALLRKLDRPSAANAKGSHILHVAAADGCVECLRCVVRCCSDIDVFMTGDYYGKTPADIAREGGHREFVKVLEDAVANRTQT
ncbi:uncharacterized protein LOC116161629 isoform X2 [Photinus pyralis]|nr:uncharacterized protein LOC116161629 isoform X2 [Photinus pyralis]